MKSKADVLNRLLELEAMRNVDVATDFVLELADGELSAAAQALGEIFARGTPGQMRFVARLFLPFQSPRGRLDPADLLAGLQRDDRPQTEDFGVEATNALMTELVRARDVASAERARPLSVKGGAEPLASIFLLLDPMTFWIRFGEWPLDSMDVIVGNVLPALDRATLERVEADLTAHRDRFTDAAWNAIQQKLSWRRETLGLPA